MADVLYTDLEIRNEQRAFNTVDNFYDKIQSVNNAINGLGKNSTFAKEFTSRLQETEKSAEKARQTFSSLVQFKPGDNSLDGLSQSAIRLQQETTKANARVRETQKILSEYKGTNQSLYNVLADDARAAEKELTRLATRSAELEKRLIQRGGTPNAGNALQLSRFQKQNLTYQANDVITGILSGLPITQIAAQQGGQIAQVFNPAQASALVAAYAPLVGILAAGAAALLLTYKITGDIRAEAEKRLKIETNLTAEFNKQNLARKKAREDLRDAENEQKFGRSFANELKNLDDDALRRRQETFRKLADLNPESPFAARNESSILAINDELARRTDERRKQADAAFNSRNENFKKSQDAAREAREKANAEFAQSVKDGQERVKELNQTTTEFFNSLFLQAGGENPFVKIFADASAAIRNVRTQTAGLSKDLQDTAERFARTNAENVLFGQRIESAFQAFDLRFDAAKFRDFVDTKKPFIDPAILENQFTFEKLATGGTFRVPIAQTPGELPKDAPASERLQKQLDLLSTFKAQTDEQQSQIDRRIIALTNGLNLAELTETQRLTAARARENEATRRETAERDALELQKTRTRIAEQQAADISELLKIAKSEGLTGVIRIINNAENQADVSLGRLPTANATADLMQ